MIKFVISWLSLVCASIGFAQDFTGLYKSDSVTLDLHPPRFGIHGGEISYGTDVFPIQATREGDALSGIFKKDSSCFSFSLTKTPQGFVFTTGKMAKLLTRDNPPDPAILTTRRFVDSASGTVLVFDRVDDASVEGTLKRNYFASEKFSGDLRQNLVKGVLQDDSGVPSPFTLSIYSDSVRLIENGSRKTLKSQITTTGGTNETWLIVPLHFGSIQEAVDGAVEGDTIIIQAGEYHEKVKMNGKTGITIKPERGQSPLLVTHQAEPIIAMEDCERIAVYGLKFQHRDEPLPINEQTGYPVGINLNISLLTSRRCKKISVKDCSFSGNQSISGIWCELGIENRIESNTFEKCLAGLRCCGRYRKEKILRDLIASDNTFLNCMDGVSCCCESKIAITKNSFRESRVGIYMFQRASVLVADNTFRKHRKQGIFGTTVACTIRGNTMENDQEGIRLIKSNCQILSNQCSKCGEGIVVSGGSIGDITGNKSSNNRATGILIIGNETKVGVTDNEAHNNAEFGIGVEDVCYPKTFSGNKASGNKVRNIIRNLKIRR